MEKVNINEKLALFSNHWEPKIVGELNGQQVKLAKFLGDFVWHLHENEDEMFYVIKGKFRMQFRNREVEVLENEFLIVPKGTEHKPVADEEVSVMIFEPKTTVNTGNVDNAFTKKNLDRLY